MVSSVNKLMIVEMSVGLVCGIPALQGCSGTGTVNEAVPTGTVIGSGTLTPLNGATGVNGTTVEGAVNVYDQGNGQYAIRLAGLNAPAQASLQIQADINPNQGSGRITIGTLVSTTGNQNYFYNVGYTTSFSVVYLHSPGAIQDEAQASLQQF